MADFKKAVDHVLNLEGGYVDDPKDSGGATRYGITESLARDYGYKEEMKKLPKKTAIDIYKKYFWDYNLLDQVSSQKIAEEIFDTSVNCGSRFAVQTLQKCLNVLNREGQSWQDINVDGRIGPTTLSIIERSLENDEDILFKCLNILQGAMYIELAYTREKDQRFIRGWVGQRVKFS